MDVHRTRYVTANYHQLQGLLLVPLGVLLILLGVTGALGILDPDGIAAAERAHLLTRMGFVYWVALGLALAAPAFYRYRYGSVEPLDRGRRNQWITAAVIGFFVLSRADAILHWPVSLSLLLISASLFITVWHDGRHRSHYLTPAVLWLAFSFLPVLDMTPSHGRYLVVALAGLTLITCGIGDHLLITRTLTDPPATDHASNTSAV